MSEIKAKFWLYLERGGIAIDYRDFLSIHAIAWCVLSAARFPRFMHDRIHSLHQELILHWKWVGWELYKGANEEEDRDVQTRPDTFLSPAFPFLSASSSACHFACRNESLASEIHGFLC